MSEIIIKAELSHLNRIKSLSRAYQIDSLSEKEKEIHGFLVSGFSESSYLDFIARAEFFYVLSIDSIIEGFILAYNDTFLDDTDFLKNEIMKRVNKPFVILKQICIGKTKLKKGYGRKLYEYLFQQTKQTPVLAAIVLDPYNAVSIEFHEKLGFNKLFEFTPKDNIKRSMWIKN